MLLVCPHHRQHMQKLVKQAKQQIKDNQLMWMRKIVVMGSLPQSSQRRPHQKFGSILRSTGLKRRRMANLLSSFGPNASSRVAKTRPAKVGLKATEEQLAFGL